MSLIRLFKTALRKYKKAISTTQSSKYKHILIYSRESLIKIIKSSKKQKHQFCLETGMYFKSKITILKKLCLNKTPTILKTMTKLSS